ncbi:MAG: ABC transporter substrate-binding protein [Treponemataceae bacterium]
MTRSFKATAILLVLMVSAGLVFAGGGKEQVEKKVVVYSSVDEANAKKILDAFTADTGIKVAFVFLSSGPAIARIKAELNNPQADVWMGAPSENHIVAKDDGLTIPYTGGDFAALKTGFKDTQGYWRSFYMNPMAFAVNTEVLKRLNAPKPTSWEDLLNPVYKGQIQMPTPQASGTAYNIVASLITIVGEEKAFDYMKALNPSVQTYTSSGTGPSKGVSVGQCAIGLQFTPAFFEFIENGYPLEVIYPKEGVWFEAPAVSILKGAKNVQSAQALVDWLISKKGQDTLTDAKTFFYPVTSGAKLGKGMPSFDSLKTVDVDVKWAGTNKKRLVERWVNEVLPAK